MSLAENCPSIILRAEVHMLGEMEAAICCDAASMMKRYHSQNRPLKSSLRSQHDFRLTKFSHFLTLEEAGSHRIDQVHLQGTRALWIMLVAQVFFAAGRQSISGCGAVHLFCMPLTGLGP